MAGLHTAGLLTAAVCLLGSASSSRVTDSSSYQTFVTLLNRIHSEYQGGARASQQPVLPTQSRQVQQADLHSTFVF